jgi:hypothetical protein
VHGSLRFGLFSAASRAALLLSAQLRAPALVPLGVCASIGLSACSCFLQAHGLAQGRARGGGVHVRGGRDDRVCVLNVQFCNRPERGS